jgi:hypothetical protein
MLLAAVKSIAASNHVIYCIDGAGAESAKVVAASGAFILSDPIRIRGEKTFSVFR